MNPPRKPYIHLVIHPRQVAARTGTFITSGCPNKGVAYAVRQASLAILFGFAAMVGLLGDGEKATESMSASEKNCKVHFGTGRGTLRAVHHF